MSFLLILSLLILGHLFILFGLEPFLFLFEGLLILLGPELGQLIGTDLITAEIGESDEQLDQVNAKQHWANKVGLKVYHLMILNDNVGRQKPQHQPQVTRLK